MFGKEITFDFMHIRDATNAFWPMNDGNIKFLFSVLAKPQSDLSNFLPRASTLSIFMLKQITNY